MQWFRKIFDINGSAVKEYGSSVRKGDSEVERRREKENKGTQGSTSSKDMQNSNNKMFL